LPFVANKGQWLNRVKYAVEIPGGRLYLENNAFTYHLFPGAPHCPDPAKVPLPVASHAFRVTMVGAAPAPALAGEDPQSGYHNYFLGNDPAKWAARVPLFAGVRYRDVYPGVDVRWHQQQGGHSYGGQLEYDFELAPQARVGAIRLRYDGLDGLAVTPDGHLQLRTSVGELREQAPVAWQLTATGQRRPVACRFVLRGHEVSFAVGAGYNPAQRLVIDPVLVFATYSGSPGGMSANCTISDAQGNMYTGSYVLGPGYPLTVGAIKTTFQYGNIGISKLSADGSRVLYATYLGGNTGAGDDYPLDFEINPAGELLILGASASSDYPTTPGAYDRTLGSAGFGLRDLVITRLNATGTGILASTFLGGNGEEAGSVSSVPAGLAVDPGGDILVVSSTTSVDYPMLNAAQPNYAGNSDGVLTRLAPGLNALRWSTYIGGSSSDRAHDVKVAPSGEVYVCGGTSSSNLPLGVGGLLPAAPGGSNGNGFVLRFSAAGARLSGTYLGTTSTDVARCLDFDAAGSVLVGGATEGTYPLTPGVFSAVVPGATAVFVHALDPTLTTTRFSTQISVVGFGALSQSNVLTGFGRDDCGRIYLCAYAGAINAPGCPRTADAFSTQPRSLYLGVLAENATGLLYGTYVGETNSNPGASFSTHLHYAAANQITRTGMLYHITCNTGRGFPTTPGAFSSGLTGSNDAACFKFNLAPSATSALQLAVAPPPAGCGAPSTVQFVNTTAGTVRYSWDFGDGSPLDTAKSPRHIYLAVGTYTARLVATRTATSTGCGPASATLAVPVVVAVRPPARTVLDSLSCTQPSLVLNPARQGTIVGGSTYAWSTGAQTPTLAVTTPGRYHVEINQGQACPTEFDYVVSSPRNQIYRIVSDSLDCSQQLVLDPARLTPFVSGRAYNWSTGARVPSVLVTTPGRYRVEIDQGTLCPAIVEYNITLRRTFPIPNIMTANGDQSNATLLVPSAYGVPQLKVFNRWGRLVYESEAYHNDWDAKGQPAGVYYYQVRQPSCGLSIRGWVEVVR